MMKKKKVEMYVGVAGVGTNDEDSMCSSKDLVISGAYIQPACRVCAADGVAKRYLLVQHVSKTK